MFFCNREWRPVNRRLSTSRWARRRPCTLDCSPRQARPGPADSSWSSAPLYCNMTSVDPLPSLPPCISHRCHSLLTLASTRETATATEVADYENLNMPSQPNQSLQSQTEHFAQQEPQFAPFGRLYQQFLRLDDPPVPATTRVYEEIKRIRASREEEDNNV